MASYSIIAHVSSVCLEVSFFSDSSVRIHFGLLRCEKVVGCFGSFLPDVRPAAVPGFFHAVEVSQGVSLAEAFSLALCYSVFIEDGSHFARIGFPV